MTKLPLLCLVFILAGFHSYAESTQAGKLDSLQVLAKKAYFSGDYSVAIVITDDLVNYYRSTGEKEKELTQMIFLGELYRANRHFDFALGTMNDAGYLALRNNFTDKLISTHNRKAAIYFEQGMFYKSLQETDTVILLSAKYRENRYLASSYNIRGTALRDLGYNKEALDFYWKAFKMAEEQGDADEMVSIYYNMAIVFLRTPDPDSSHYYAQKGLAIAYLHQLGSRIKHGYNISASAYLLKHDSISAGYFQRREMEVADSLQKINSMEQKEFVEASYLAPFKERENETLKKLNSNIQVTLTLVAALCLLLLASIFYIFRKNKELNRLNDKLHLQRTAIEEQNRELGNLNSIKDKLFSIIAHDLRNPIRSMAMALTFLNESDTTDDDKGKLMVEMEKNTLHVQEMIENLLRWSQTQLKGEKLNREHFQLKDLILENIDLLKDMAEKKNISLELTAGEAGRKVFADKEMIRFVIRNLTTNAIKFTQPGGKVTIAIQQDVSSTKVLVKDTGIGISPEKMATLFHLKGERSYGTTQEKGTGLGLALCKEFTEKNNGTLEVKSQPGKGSEFELLLLNS